MSFRYKISARDAASKVHDALDWSWNMKHSGDYLEMKSVIRGALEIAYLLEADDERGVEFLTRMKRELLERANSIDRISVAKSIIQRERHIRKYR